MEEIKLLIGDFLKNAGLVGLNKKGCIFFKRFLKPIHFAGIIRVIIILCVMPPDFLLD